MQEETAQTNEVIYDAKGIQKIPLDDNIFAVVKPYEDERFLKYQEELANYINEKLKESSDVDVTEAEVKKALELDLSLAKELTETLQGYPDLPSDWKDLISTEDYLELLRTAHTFTIDEDQKAFSLGKLVVPTACWFNGEVARQKHHLRKKTIDDSSRYALIKSKEFEAKKAKRLGKKDYAVFTPQHLAKAELYDEMKESAEGFKNDFVPLRVKSLVIDYIFVSSFNQKKSR